MTRLVHIGVFTREVFCGWPAEKPMRISLPWRKTVSLQESCQNGCNHVLLIGLGQCVFRSIDICGSICAMRWSECRALCLGMWFIGNRKTNICECEAIEMRIIPFQPSFGQRFMPHRRPLISESRKKPFIVTSHVSIISWPSTYVQRYSLRIPARHRSFMYSNSGPNSYLKACLNTSS
jgi:hypothetical protein